MSTKELYVNIDFEAAAKQVLEEQQRRDEARRMEAESMENTISVKYDLLMFSNGKTSVSCPADSITGIQIQNWEVEIGVMVNFEWDSMGWFYKCVTLEDANILHGQIFNAWADARITADRAK